MGSSTISLGLGLGGGKAATSSGSPGGGGAFSNEYSVEFDGTDDYVDIPHDSSLDTAGSMSFSVWIYADDVSGYKTILAKRANTNFDWQFAITGSKFQFYDGGAGSSLDSATSPNASQWYHVVFSVDYGVTNGTKIYINGSSDAQGTFSPNSELAPMRIGDNSKNRFFNGKIDEVSWFHSALSASDVTAIYNSGTPTDLTSYSPVGWWRMGDNDGGTGTTITDQGSGGNDGTLTNGPTYSTTVPS